MYNFTLQQQGDSINILNITSTVWTDRTVKHVWIMWYTTCISTEVINSLHAHMTGSVFQALYHSI